MSSGNCFKDETPARDALERLRWPHGAVCPCGSVGESGYLERQNCWKCYRCHKQFTVRWGTVLARGHLPLHRWLEAARLYCSAEWFRTEWLTDVGFTRQTAARMAELLERVGITLTPRDRRDVEAFMRAVLRGAGVG